MADYENFVGGSLKLKSRDGVQDGKIKKKKKKKKHKKDLERVIEQTVETGSSDNEEKDKTSEADLETRTKAELAFEKHREKKQAERLLEKASKTHKERIMEFNSHLDNLTEHFDIPKVSWTK